MNILITGGAGFIGSFLAEKNLEDGHNVMIIDDLSRGKIDNIAHILEKINFVNLDISKGESTQKISELIEAFKPEIIYHYAAVNGTMHFYDHSYRTCIVNSIGTLNLLNAIEATFDKNSTIPKIVFASTSEVYGEPKNLPTTELDTTYARLEEVRDSYSVAKQYSEFLVKLWCEKNKAKYNILRIFNVYGPRMVDTKYGQVIPEFIKRLKDGESPLRIVGDGKQTRSFIYVTDHVDMVTLVAKNELLDNQVINIGSDKEISIAELAKTIINFYNFDNEVLTTEARDGDIIRRCPDIQKFRKLFPKFEHISLLEGLQKMENFNAIGK